MGACQVERKYFSRDSLAASASAGSVSHGHQRQVSPADIDFLLKVIYSIRYLDVHSIWIYPLAF